MYELFGYPRKENKKIKKEAIILYDLKFENTDQYDEKKSKKRIKRKI
jgi:hypothetical protein